MIYNFNISGDKIELLGSTCAVTGSLNYYQCRFEFSDEWRELEKFAVFIRGEDTYTVIVENDVCYIPSEFLSSSGTVRVGVYGTSCGGDNPVRISTDFSHIIIEEGAYREGNAPCAPTPDLWEDYFRQLAEKSAQAAKDAIDNSLGDISAALDAVIAQQEAIIAIQNQLIGGDGK